MASEQYGMTGAGFIPKRLADIQSDLNLELANIVDPSTGEYPFQNAADDAILQQVVGVFASALEEAWEAAYEASVQFDPQKNAGAGQSGTVQLNAITRKAGTRTILSFDLTGTPGVLVPAGTLIASASGEAAYAIQENVIFPAAEDGQRTSHATARGVCTEYGAFNPEPGTVNTIQTPVAGFFNASNTATESVGTAQETDEELRKRQQRYTQLTSYRQIDAIYAAVLAVEGVTYCRAYQNTNTYPVDARGIPFKEVAVVAEGGDPDAITDALFLRFPVGVIGHGSISITKYDQQGVGYPISFSRPTPVPVYVNVIVEITNRSEFPDNGIQLIKESIVAYAQYGDTSNTEGFPPGENVIRTRIYTPINAIAGHEIILCEIGTAQGSLAEENIPIAWNQVATFDTDDITVTVRGQ